MLSSRMTRQYQQEERGGIVQPKYGTREKNYYFRRQIVKEHLKLNKKVRG